MKIKDKADNIINNTKSRVSEIDLKSKLKFKKEDKLKKPKEEVLTLDEELQLAIDQYNLEYSILNEYGSSLHNTRVRSIDLIDLTENLINSISNTPKSFESDIREIEINRKEFIDVSQFAKKELESAKKSAIGAGAGLAAGTAVAALAPTTAIWVATTFGTASTGTAISALSGAAATNAALAWLGGGALAAGGSGMAAGHTLLALAGPIGWGLSGATLLTSIVLFNRKRILNNKDKQEEIVKVKINAASVKKDSLKINLIYEETNILRENLNEQYKNSLIYFSKNYLQLSDSSQLSLGVLVNNTKALAKTLSQSI